MKTLLIILILAAIIVFIVLQTSEVNRKCESRKRYSDLWDFYHFVGTCPVNDSNRAYIGDRIKSEQSLNVDEKALHIVEMCEQVFNARFK